jgi:S-DNA-T family DNA segregation ATPase FtsK/SpoIIIE
VLSLFIITRTPPNKIGERLRELYAWLFGAQLPDADERQAARDAKLEKQEKTAQVELDGVDGDGGDTSALPWWRRNNSKREEDPDFGGAISVDDRRGDTHDSDPLSTLLGGDGRGSFDTALEPAEPTDPSREHYGTEVLEDLVRAEDAVKRFTGEVEPHAAAIGLHADDPEGLTEALPGFEELEAALAAPPAAATAPQPTAPYVLPSATTLIAGPPAKARSAANDDIVRSLSSGLLSTDLEGNIRTINPTGVEMFGIAAEGEAIVLRPDFGELAVRIFVEPTEQAWQVVDGVVAEQRGGCRVYMRC